MFEALKILSHNRTTYQIGLLQARAYRALKQVTGAHLAPFDLSTAEWGFLGLLLDTGGLTPTRAGEELGVETPFVTAMTRTLKAKGFVIEEKDPNDNRRKTLRLTLAGEEFVVHTETHMRACMRPLIDGVSKRALMDYVLVLTQILKNVQKK